MKRQTLLRSIFFACVGGVLAGSLGPAAAAPQEYAVKLTEVDDLKAVFATVESVRVASARTRIGGTISELNIIEGRRVEKGQQIALVVDPKLRLQIDALEARIQSLEAQRMLAKTAYERVNELWKGGNASKAKLDEAKTNLSVAERQLSAMKSERDVVSQQRAEGAVLAPSNGRILKVNVTTGTNVGPGDVVATLTAEAYILRMLLPERHARFIHEGQGVMVGELGAGPDAMQVHGDMRTGRIRQVYPELQQGRVKADIDVDGLGNYFVGERMPVYVSTGKRQTYMVPAEYLFQRYGTTYARVKGTGDVVVQIGQTVGDKVEILSGLKDGDTILMPEARQ